MAARRDQDIVIDARDIRKEYRMGPNRLSVLKGVTLSVAAGERVSIMGASGAGKSTLLHILGGLDRPTGGEVVFQGRNLYALPAPSRAEVRALRIGFVFQAYHLLPELSILENVMLPSMSRFGAWRQWAANCERATSLLEEVGLAERAEHRPMELSGGEQQRAAIARSLMNEPDLLFADEPTGNLDSATGELVLRYLFEMSGGRGHTLVLVTHNETIAGMCERRLHLKDGCLNTENMV